MAAAPRQPSTRSSCRHLVRGTARLLIGGTLVLPQIVPAGIALGWIARTRQSFETAHNVAASNAGTNTREHPPAPQRLHLGEAPSSGRDGRDCGPAAPRVAPARVIAAVDLKSED